jgi:hypothetical protein
MPILSEREIGMRINTIVRFVIPITVAAFGVFPSLAGEIPFSGTIMDTSFDCLGPCQSLSIMYDGPAGMVPAKEIAPFSAWQSLSDAGLPGDWISFEPSGAGGVWPMPGEYTFKVTYSFKPSVEFNSVKFSILADDFATVSATGLGPLPGGGDAYKIGAPCSVNPPGCIMNHLYQVSLTGSDLTAFAKDTTLVFTLTQWDPPPTSVQRATPFGLAFNIQATGIIDPPAVAPEPNSLGLLVIGVGLFVALRSTPIWRQHGQKKPGA